MEEGTLDLKGLIEESAKGYWTGPPLTEEMVRVAEERLGYRLPETYLRLLRLKNGLTLKRERSCFPTEVATSYASDHVGVDAIRGIGHPRGIDAERGSRFLIDEWRYPDVGIVFGATPGGGHTAVMLDYSACGPRGEPRVIYVVAAEVEEEDNQVILLAPDFETFLRGLRGPEEFD